MYAYGFSLFYLILKKLHLATVLYPYSSNGDLRTFLSLNPESGGGFSAPHKSDSITGDGFFRVLFSSANLKNK